MRTLSSFIQQLDPSRLVQLGSVRLPACSGVDWQFLNVSQSAMRSALNVDDLCGIELSENDILLDSVPLQCLSRPAATERVWKLGSCAPHRVIVRSSSFPGSSSDQKHITVAPQNAWRKLFEAAGFVVDTSEYIRFDSGSYEVDSSWRGTNPYRENDQYGETVMLLSSDRTRVSEDKFKAEAAAILGTSSNLNLSCESELTFLLGHYQEFLQFEPFFESMPGDSIRVLIRAGAFAAIETQRLRMIESYLQSRNIRFEHVSNPEDVEWSDASRQAVVTAIDSTATPSHLVNSAFLLEFSRQGIRTFQLQHGLWPHGEFAQPVTFLADRLLQWSSDFAAAFQLDESAAADSQKIIDTGCPRFDAYSDNEQLELSDLFGDWVKAYRNSIFLATNLHWPAHALGAKVLPQLVKTANEMPDTIFVCKLHPAHDYDPSKFAKMPSNVVIVDEFASLQAGLSTPRLLRACDDVVCTVGTVVLESVLAGKAPIVLDTGNHICYQGIELVEIESLSEEIRRPASDRKKHEINEFIETYYSVKPGNSLKKVLGAIENTPRSNPNPDASRIANCAFAKEFLSETVQRFEQQNNLLRSGESSKPTLLPESSDTRKPKIMKRIVREVKRLRDQLSGLLLGKSDHSTRDGDRIQIAEIPSKEVTVAEPGKKLGLGELENRDQIPMLLDHLGLTGFGIELGVAAAEYSDIILSQGNLRLLFSVDRWSDHHDDAECAFASRVLSKHGARSAVLKMTFEEASKLFADHSLDFIYLDGYAHTGQDGIETLKTWWNKLKPGGLFAGHDYHESWPETQKVVKAFTELYNLQLFQTAEDPNLVEHAYPSWYLRKSEAMEGVKAA